MDETTRKLVSYLGAELITHQQDVDRNEDCDTIDIAYNYHNALGARDAVLFTLRKVAEIHGLTYEQVGLDPSGN